MHRAPPTRFLAFITLWSILVYYPVARWSWHSDGWSRNLGIMDFAGGTPVHIVSGTTVAAFAIFCSIEEKSSGKLSLAAGKALQTLGQRLYKRLISPWFELWENLCSLFRLFAVCFFGKTPPPPPPLVNRHAQSGDESDGDEVQEVEPYSVNYVILGTALLVSPGRAALHTRRFPHLLTSAH